MISNFPISNDIFVFINDAGKVYTAWKVSKYGVFSDNSVFGHFSRSAKFTFSRQVTQSALVCSKLTIETVEQGVKYIQS